MGNKATTTTKNGKKKRTARRTSVLLQQLTDKEYRQGQLNIKEHEYLLKEIIYLDQFLDNIAVEMGEFDDVTETSKEWDEKVRLYKKESELKSRKEKATKRLLVTRTLIQTLKRKATKRMSMTGIEMADPNDINLLNQLDQLLAASGEFLSETGKTVVDGTATTLSSGTNAALVATGDVLSGSFTVINRTARSISNVSKPVVDATVEGIQSGVNALGKEVEDVVSTLPISQINNKKVDDLSVTTGAAVVLTAETVALGVNTGAKQVVSSTQKVVKDALKDGSDGIFSAFIEKDRR